LHSSALVGIRIGSVNADSKVSEKVANGKPRSVVKVSTCTYDVPRSRKVPSAVTIRASYWSRETSADTSLALPMSGSPLTSWQMPEPCDEASVALVPVIVASGVSIENVAVNAVSSPVGKAPPP